MRLTLNDMSLSAIDAISGIDALCLFIGEDERPLKGLAGYTDWRMCGALSSILRSGYFAGNPGDCLLYPTVFGVGVQRVFFFGMGSRREFRQEAIGGALRTAMDVLQKAGCTSLALEIPGVTEANANEVAQAFIGECVSRFSGSEIVLLDPEAPALSLAFQQSSDALKELQVTLDDQSRSLVRLKKSAARPA